MYDHFLLNNNKQIIFFKKATHIKDNIVVLSRYNFKTVRFKNWSKDLKKLKTLKSDCTFDLDTIYKIFINFTDPLKLNISDLKDYIDFINIAGDYAHQIKCDKLLRLRREKNIDLLWEYTYDVFFWGVKGNEKVKLHNKMKKAWNKQRFRSAFQEIFTLFTGSFMPL